MKLDLGGQETISDPTPEQVAHYLRFTPAQSPFIILDRCEGEFVQAIAEEDVYRVEYKQDEIQWFTDVDYDKAVSIFDAFLHESGNIHEMAAWEKLDLSYPAATKWIVLVFVLIMLGFLGLGVWLELDKWLEIYR